MFKPGELIRRKYIAHRSGVYCVVIKKDENDYTVYNNTLKRIQLVAVPVIDSLYSKEQTVLSGGVC